jgi:hypothetical protein
VPVTHPASNVAVANKMVAELTRLDQLGMGASLCSLATPAGIIQR